MKTRIEQMSAVLSRKIHLSQSSQTKKLLEKIVFRNNQFHLNISEQEAQKMGVGSSEYQKVLSEIDATNRFISKSKGRSKLSMSQFKLNPVALSGKIRGQISVDGQEQRIDTGWAPEGSTHVRFKCWSYALIKFFICSTESMGGVVYFGTDWSIFSAPTIDVPIAASNTSVKVAFSQASSTGGSCTWEFIRK